MNKYRRHQRMEKPWHGLHSAIWLIGLAVLFFTGLWWPGILVLVGLSMVLEWVLAEASPRTFEPGNQSAPLRAPAPPSAPKPTTTAPATQMVFTPAAPYHPAAALPSACSHCGGPVRAYEVKWTGRNTANCAYCGSALPLREA